MNWFDLVVVVLVVIACVIGFRSGALPQIVGLAGAILGGAIAILVLPLLEDPLSTLDPDIRAFVVLAGVLISVGIGEAIGSAIGRTAATLDRRGGVRERLTGSLARWSGRPRPSSWSG